MTEFKNKLPGIALCIAIATPAFLLGKQFPIVGGPVFGILIGMCLALVIKSRDKIQPGLAYTSKKVLQYAVILLGFGLNLSIILNVGKQSLPIILSTIATSLITSYILFRLLKAQVNTSVLIGVGSSICGGSAIAATAPVIGASDEEIAQSISVIFLFNVIAALIFPTLGTALGMTNEGFALFAGTAVNDTSSVTAAAAAWDGLHPGSNSLQLATIVKLTRTLAIIPITLALAFYRAEKAKRLDRIIIKSTVSKSLEADGILLQETEEDEVEIRNRVSLWKIFPHFILFFLLASIITTVFHLQPSVTAPIKELSKFFIIMAMSSIGLNTNLVKLIKTGGKPLFMGLCCWMAIALVSLGMQHVLGLW